MRYSIHNHTFWTKLDLCETMFALYSACQIPEFASARFPFALKLKCDTDTCCALHSAKQIPHLSCVHVRVCRCEDARSAAQRACQEMSDNLRRITQDKQSVDLRTAAELDDLYRTKINLEERLVELIRSKFTYRHTDIHTHAWKYQLL